MQWWNRLEFCVTTQLLGLPRQDSEKSTPFTWARIWGVFTRSPSFQNLPVCRSIGCVVHPSLLFIAWHPVGMLKWQSEVGPEVREQCHLLHKKGNSFMFVSSPCMLYLLWRPGRVCALASAAELLPQKPPEAANEYWMAQTKSLTWVSWKNPKALPLGHLKKSSGHTSEVGKPPVTPSSLSILPWHSQVCFIKTSSCQYIFPT